jgi:hypothetical protein
MTPCCPKSTWSCCCSIFHCSACGYGTLTCSLDMLTCPGYVVFDSLPHLLSLTLTDRLWKANWHLHLRCWSVAPCDYNHCVYFYLTLLLIYECLNILAMYCYNLHRHSQKRTGHPSEPGSSLCFFIGSCLSREFFLATVLLHLNWCCLGL